MNWYYLNDAGEVAGPVSPSTLAELHTINRLADNTQVCLEGSEDWISLAEALGTAIIIPCSSPEADTPTHQIAPKKKNNSSKGALIGVIGFVMLAAGAMIFLFTRSNGTKSSGQSESVTEARSEAPDSKKGTENKTPTLTSDSTQRTDAKDPKKEESANPTDSKEQYYIGMDYSFGTAGRPKDLKKAVVWFEKSALQGHQPAQIAIGLAYYEGKGVPVDYHKAAHWFTVLAEQGWVPAQNQLGRLHLSGQLGEVNAIEAYKWLDLASRGENLKEAEESSRWRDLIAAQMNPAQLKEAKVLVHNWKKKSYKELAEIDAATKKVNSSGLPPYVNSLGMKFSAVEIPSGSSKGKTVLFSIWETRRRDYAAYADAIKSVDRSWKSGNGSKGFLPENKDPDTPVTWINTEDAKGFCRWLTDIERRRGLIPEGAEYRLPTDHEWSCAAGLGAKEDPDSSAEEKNGFIADIFPWGTEWPPAADVGNLGHAGQSKLLPVGKFKPGPYGLYDMAGNVSEIVVDPNAQSRFIEIARGTSSLVDLESFAKSMFYSSARISIDLDPDSPTQEMMENGRCNDSGFRCILFYNGDPNDLLALVGRKDVPDNDKPTTEKQPNGVQATSKTIDAALPAFKIFQKSTLDEARECVRLLDEQLKQDPGNTRIQKVRSTIMDIFREEALLTQARSNYQKAENLLATEKRNLEITSKPSSLTGNVNQSEVARTRGEVNAAQAAMQSEKSKSERSRSSLQKLLNDAISGLPEEEREALAPVWRQVAKRHQIILPVNNFINDMKISHPIVGRWIFESKRKSLQYQFRADNSMSGAFLISGRRFEGTWKADGDKVVISKAAGEIIATVSMNAGGVPKMKAIRYDVVATGKKVE